MSENRVTLTQRLLKPSSPWVLLAELVAVFAVGFFVSDLYGRIGSSGASSVESATAQDHDQTSGPQMWTCSMHPQIRQPNPGDCPICGMDLIPVATSSGGMRTLTISPETEALMNIASTPVERRYVSHKIPMVGKVDYDETKLGYITAWVAGRLDRLFVDFTGVQVNKGDHMVYIYSPELYAAQEELIQSLRYRRERDSSNKGLADTIDLVESGREKLRLLGLTQQQIAEIEQQEKPTDHLTIYAPTSGIVIDKLKQEGDYVKTGEQIYTVADLNQVWVHLDAYEADLPWIRYGQDVTVTTEAYPGEEFHGRISFIQPVLNDKTRTVKVRVNVPNSGGKLKPDMFVRADVEPQVAEGGRVMDPSLAGKWISPMHPEIVKNEPGNCDICGMPLVRAETLGYVTPNADEAKPPLVIPYSAALVTGRRAIVYVELPVMPDGVETAFQGIGAALDEGSLEQVRQAFDVFSTVLDHPYDQPGSGYARRLWDRYADLLAEPALAGKRVQSMSEAKTVYARVETIMDALREEFGPIGQPTFEGREIVLGPRAGNFYLVWHGLEEGEMVVTQGNFKIDAEIQIQAKPSMMTPEGGGGGGHDHGGSSKKKPSGDEHAGHTMTLPAEFSNQIRELEAAYEQVAQVVEESDLSKITTSFAQFDQMLSAVDGSILTGHARMQWKEFAMLLGNDAVEGRDAEQMAEADRVFLLLKGHMRRMRDQLGIMPGEPRHVEHIAVTPEFQSGLAAVWERYLSIQKALAADEYEQAQGLLASLETAVVTVDDSSLSGSAQEVWQKEQANLSKLIDSLKSTEDVKAMRTAFKPLSEEVGVLAKSFGFGEAGSVFELHCPMAFQGQGAVWYQSDDQVRNPYYGASMLKCADRVEQVLHDKPTDGDEHKSHQDHSQH
ncbi:MAG: efflux RND transporter periplasmic adaptor subunit [Planctomycetaceae bacterium]|nr:efflux RND transporter periplasmic adaptor subunit [Planctomycetaceae bacterium]